MSTLYVEPVQKSQEVFDLVRAAITSQIARFELGVQLARQRLATFEQKYDVTSAHFMAKMAAEDLAGGDDEYVQWAGEYLLLQRLEEKLRQLTEIKYRDPTLL